jgi:uncharacterized protein (TIGR02757 family)
MARECLRAGCEALLLARGSGQLAHDPVSLVRPYPDPRDREVAGLVAASLAFGRVARILESVRRVLDVLGPRPGRFLASGAGEFARDLDGFRHRWVGEVDVVALLRGLGILLRESESVEAAFAEDLRAAGGDLRGALSGFARRIARFAGDEARARRGFRFLLPDAMGGGASKRLCLYLRWMVRPDDGIDMGVWTALSPSRLVIPLDTHVLRIARLIGLTERRTANWATAVEITDALRTLCPGDPVRYDFALAHLGISGDCPNRCGGCPFRAQCRGRPRKAVVQAGPPAGKSAARTGEPSAPASLKGRATSV